MVLRKRSILFKQGIILLLLLFITADGHGQSPAKVEKRISKSIASAWPGKDLSRVPVELTGEYPQEGESEGAGKIFKLTEAEETVGWMVLASAKGRYDFFDYLILYDSYGMIMEVNILVYRSDHGYEIMNKGWLRQFVGERGCDLVYGKDIDAISGATISAGALTTDIQKWCKLLMAACFIAH